MDGCKLPFVSNAIPFFMDRFEGIGYHFDVIRVECNLGNEHSRYLTRIELGDTFKFEDTQADYEQHNPLVARLSLHFIQSKIRFCRNNKRES